MKFGICTESVIPVRLEASDRAEMVTQLLFGEKIRILQKKNQWIFIKAKYDDYEGWIDAKMINHITEDFFLQDDTTVYASNLFNLIVENDTPFTVTIGAALENFNREHALSKINDRTFDYLSESIDTSSDTFPITDVAKQYINTPYLWGGKSSFGIDCSGFTQQVFKLVGIFLPRDAYQQANYGEVLGFIEEALPGDLAFFDNADGAITHVGIMLQNQKIIHAHGKVRIDPIDSTGIFNTDSQKYSHKLRFIRRIEKA